MSQLPAGFVLDQPASAPQSGPVYGPPPVPKAPDPIAEEGLRLRQQAEARQAQAQAQSQSLAERKFQFQQQQAGAGEAGTGSTPVPVSTGEKTGKQVENYATMQSAASTFQDDFGGNPLGGLENTTEQYLGIGTPGQSQWWANFRRLDNQIRNELFGSALSAQEKQAYSQTTIEPGMRPEMIRSNLAERSRIMRAALGRQREFLLSNGYKQEAVDSLFAPILEQQDALLETSGVEVAGAGDNVAQETIAQGEMRRADNPALSGVQSEYRRRLAGGQSAGELIAWARSAGVDPSAFQSIAEQVNFRDANPDVSISEYDTNQIDDEFVPVSQTEQMMGKAAMSAPGAFVANAADAMTGFNLDSLAGMMGGNAERVRLAQGEINRESPVASLAGMVAGGVATALGGEAAIAGKVGSSLPAMLAADAGYGALAGAGMTDYAADGTPATIGDRAVGAGMGTLAGLAGSYAGNKAGQAIGAAARGVTNSSVRSVQDAGVPLTLGQQVGNSGRVGAAIKGAEDRIAGLPILGDMVNARRSEGYLAFNSKAFDNALEPIGGSVEGKVAEEAVESAQQQVSNAFEQALSGKFVQADQQFAADFTNAVTRTMALPRVGGEVADGLREILAPYMQQGTTTIDGKVMQQVSRELRGLKAGYKNDPLKKRIGDAIDAVEESVFGVFRRQAPEVVPEYEKAKKAARRLYIVEDAVNRAKNKDGVFTTGQLGMADRTNAKKFDGASSAARGNSPMHDFQRNMQNTLPNEVPDSGTAGRLILPAAAAGLVGADAGLTDDGLNAGTLTLATILAGAYTRAGQRIMTKPGRGSDTLGRVTGPKTNRALAKTGSVSGVLATQ